MGNNWTQTLMALGKKVDFGKGRFGVISPRIYRVFIEHKPTINHHGRWYHYLQNFPSRIRKKLLINGNPVCELDYAGLHPTMLYIMEGMEPPKNIYKYSKTDDPIKRENFKVCSLICFNCPGDINLTQAIRKKFFDLGRYDCLKASQIRALIEEFKEFHSGIAKYINSGIGPRLMRLDSLLMEYVFENFGHVMLPVHDSCIAEAVYEGELKQVMIQAFQEVMGTGYKIKVD